MSVSSTETEAVELLVDLLDNAPAGTWTNAAPEVHAVWEVSQRGRQNNPDPALYVWSPVEGPVDALSGFDYDRLDEQATVEIQVWTLDSVETSQYASDIVNYLAGDYANDNEANTPYHRIRPADVSDERAATQTRPSEHFVTTVTVEGRRLRDV